MSFLLTNSARRNISLFGVFWLLILILYHQSLHSQFNDDFIACVNAYKRLGPSGWASSFEYTSFYFGHNVAFYGFYLLFGLNEWAWHLYMTGTFAINALLLVVVIENVFNRHQFTNSTILAIITSLLFIACPYQTETVTWAATIHYQVTMIGLLLGMLTINSYILTAQRKYLIALYFIFAVLLVTLEESLVFPAIWGIYFLIYTGNISKETIVKGFKVFVVPMASFIAVYFIATRIVKGSFVPHYGSAVHLANWTPKVVIGTYTRYLMKLLGLVHFFKYEVRDKIYSLTDKWGYLLFIWVPVIGALGYLFTTRHRRSAMVVVCLLVLAAFTLLPSLNMYFMYLNRVENDRLSFFAIPFLYCIPAYIITRFKPYVWVPFVVVVFIVMQHFLQLCIGYWVGAAEVQRRTLNTFHFEGKKKLFIINLPVNYNGAYVYRKYWRFPAAMNVIRDTDISKPLEVIAGQNLFDLNDGVNVVALDSITYDATIVGSGWFYGNVHNSDGVGDGYTYTAEGNKCVLHLAKPLAADEAIIYQTGGNWREAKRWQALNQP